MTNSDPLATSMGGGKVQFKFTCDECSLSWWSVGPRHCPWCGGPPEHWVRVI